MTLWERVSDMGGQALSFAQSVPGLLVIGLMVALTGLFFVHRRFAASLLKKNVRKYLIGVEEKLVSLKAERDEARTLQAQAKADLNVARPVWENAEAIKRGLARMEKVWLQHGNVDTSALSVPLEEAQEDEEILADSHGVIPPEVNGGLNEDSCEIVLRENLWVFYPDFIETNQINRSSKIAISTILREHFEGLTINKTKYRLGLNLGHKPDICGWFYARSSLRAGFPTAEPVYVIVELKNSQEPVKRRWIEQVHAYAYTLMLKVDALWGKRIECFVIGSEIQDDVNDVQLNWGNGKNDAINITPLTYVQLYERAKWIASTFIPGLEMAGDRLPMADEAIEPILELDEPIEETEPEVAAITDAEEEAPLALTDIVEEPTEESVEAASLPELEILGEPDVVEAPEPAEAAEQRELVEKHRRLQGLLDQFHKRGPK